MKKRRGNSQKAHMVPKILFTVLSIFLLLAAFSLFDGAIATAHITSGKDKAMSSGPTDIAELPCIPGWAKRFAAPVEKESKNRLYFTYKERFLKVFSPSHV